MYVDGVTQLIDVKQLLLKRLNDLEKKTNQSYLTVLGPGDNLIYKMNPDWIESPYSPQKKDFS